jgi:site-specific DNA-methyltransferase (adenine-specific)
VVFSRQSDEWRTPRELFERLDAEFGFDLDVAARKDNCWKENYIGPDRIRPDRTDALECSWTWLTSSARPAVCWMNPPYSRVREFMGKARMESLCGCTVVCLVPARTDTRWWHSFVWDGVNHQPQQGVEVRFLKGRLKFGEGKNSAPFPSCVVIFRPPPSWRDLNSTGTGGRLAGEPGAPLAEKRLEVADGEA